MRPFERTEALANKLDIDHLAGNHISHSDALELIHAFKAELRDFRAENQPAPMKKMPHIVDAITTVADSIKAYMGKVKDSGDTTGLLVSYYHLNEGYKKLDEARKLVYHIKDRHDKGVIPEMFETLKQDNIRVPEVARSFYPLTKWSAKIVDKVALHDWLPKVGLDGLITTTVNSSELTAALKERLLETGQEPPDDIVELRSYKTTGMSRYNPKSK